MIKQILLTTIFSTLFNIFGCKGQSDKNKPISMDTMKEYSDEAIKEFMNRPIYSTLTLQILDSIPNDKLEQTIIDNIYAKIDDKDLYKRNYSTITSLSEGRQAIFATWGLEAEVNNGGFNQYFFNFSTSGQFAEEARDGFKLIGAYKYSELTQKAIVLFLKNAKQLSKFNDGSFESFSKSYENNPLNDLDTKFYDLSKIENLSELRIKYIRAHRLEFIDN
jgi:hypothetical protein